MEEGGGKKMLFKPDGAPFHPHEEVGRACASTRLCRAEASPLLPSPLHSSRPSPPQDHPPKFWGVRQYEYWDEQQQDWTDVQPAACLIRGVPQPAGWQWRNGSPRTAASCKEYYCTYENVWWVGAP